MIYLVPGGFFLQDGCNTALACELYAALVEALSWHFILVVHTPVTSYQ